jgi:monoamine oxidase
MNHVPSGERLRLVREQIAKLVFPELAGAANGLGFAKLWAEDPWAGGGAWLALPRGQSNLGSTILARAEGRVHFAGEHTAVAGGWMQGAIESGQRAAREVLAAG